MALSSTIFAWGRSGAGYLMFGISSKSILYYSAYLVLGFALFYFVLSLIGGLFLGRHYRGSLGKENKVSEALKDVVFGMTGNTLLFTAIFQWFATVDLLFRHWRVTPNDHTYGYVTFMCGFFTLIAGTFILIADFFVVFGAAIAGYCLAVICRFIIKIVWFPVSWLWCKFETYANKKIAFISNTNSENI